MADDKNEIQQRDDDDIDDGFESSLENNETTNNADLHLNSTDEEIQNEQEDDLASCLHDLVDDAKEQAEQIAHKIWDATWNVIHFCSLPAWMQDNEFLLHGHRPPLPSFKACLASIFRLHSETGNIWSHLLGFLLFLGTGIYVYTRPEHEVESEDKFVFLPFFLGAMVCMAFSSAFHTLYCHSEAVGKFFLKLDYVGISLMIMGSFIPWLYYGFYCSMEPKVAYITLIVMLGIACIVISFFDKFSAPDYRPIRAGVFTLFGASGVIPACHYFLTKGIWSAFYEASFGWLIVMTSLYSAGATLYAFRIPERFFPGKCDIWFHSHQIFHLLVVFASFVNYQGITELASWRNAGSCAEADKLSDMFQSQQMKMEL